ncbi:peptide/nickel transport system substrate-binding protein [Saccharothrix tamanrassetensis]|uniref:Peptide/nickel transport system substrate-binding protein n=1 Tax=Saccharothrix tamanrassetensis TaxID=1051531 RepID=A0A841CKB6_9PSEU|nr:ABC transporter substrate-binding protein [Saccharothrix tamanrassetensis]MBB5958942.1 peptide/nickel transport system substrate-binding protein [Saccharothrix tamanrassetensis]
MAHSRTARRRWTAAIGLTGVAALALSACAQSDRGDESGSGKVGGTLTFGAAGAPKLFDPFYATDGETFRVSRQMYEGLVGFKAGSADVEPALATKWESSTDGKTWTFTLKENVKFHDGSPFNAEAVCFNFNRWYNQKGPAQSDAVSQYWLDNFGGFADTPDKPSLFKSCTAKDAKTTVVELTTATSQFPSVLGFTSFSISSPEALKKYDADNVVAAGDSFTYPAYANEHPTGTGPFKFSKFDKANNVVELVRNEDYHGTKAKLDKVVFRIIPDETARKQALKAGDIDGYDLPNAADWAGLKTDGFDVKVRPAFNVLYLGINQLNNPKLQDLKVRQAVMYAINREQLVKSQLPEGATVATQFMPPLVDGYNKSLTAVKYDPEKAKSLLAEAGASDLTLKFYWPTEVTRPYMPSPKDLYSAVAGDLDKAGIKVEAVSKPWNGGYLTDVDQGIPDLFMLGWTGDNGTAHNWVGTFFGRTDNRFNTGKSPWGKDLADKLAAANAEPDEGKRTALYEDVNKKIMEEYLPAIPISHSPPALVFKKEVQGVTPSPLTDERFGTTTKG